MKKGIFYAAMGHYPEVIAQAHEKSLGMKTFLHRGLFAEDPINALRAFIKSDLAAWVGLNLVWSDDHNYDTRENWDRLQNETDRALSLVSEFPGKEFFIAGFTEHNLTEQRARKQHELLSSEFEKYPNVTLVNSVWKGATLRGVINEVHGGDARPHAGLTAFDFDGTNALDAAITRQKRRFERAETFCMWHPNCNGIRNLEKGATRPPRHEREHWLQADVLKHLIACLLETEIPGKLQKGIVWKSSSDRTVTPDPRSGKPVLLGDLQASHVELRDSEGRLICLSQKAEKSKHGEGNLYRFDIPALQMRRVARGKCLLMAAREMIGSVDPIFRRGGFRNER